MSKIKWLLIGLVIGIVLVQSIGFTFIWGSGRVVSENRTVPGFQGIDLSGSPEVFIRQGAKQSLVVRTDDNLLKHLETRVEGGTLKIRFREGVSRVTQCKIYITMAQLRALNISGSGSIQSENRFDSNDVATWISGSGNLKLNLETRRAMTRISGSGNCELKGKADELTAEISGSGNLNAFDFPVPEADVAISGSGNCNLDVSRALTARISGSGSVSYRGNPTVNAAAFGSGQIRAVN